MCLPFVGDPVHVTVISISPASIASTTRVRDRTPFPYAPKGAEPDGLSLSVDLDAPIQSPQPYGPRKNTSSRRDTHAPRPGAAAAGMIFVCRVPGASRLMSSESPAGASYLCAQAGASEPVALTFDLPSVGCTGQSCRGCGEAPKREDRCVFSNDIQGKRWCHARLADGIVGIARQATGVGTSSAPWSWTPWVGRTSGDAKGMGGGLPVG